MKRTIEELAWEYVASIAGTDPNTDISLFENEYNAFVAGANAVKNNVDLADVVGQSEQLCQTCNGSKKLYDKVFGIDLECPDC